MSASPDSTKRAVIYLLFLSGARSVGLRNEPVIYLIFPARRSLAPAGQILRYSFILSAWCELSPAHA